MRSSRSDSGRNYPGHASKATAQQARGEGFAATDEGGGDDGDNIEPRDGLGGQREAGGGAAEHGAGRWGGGARRGVTMVKQMSRDEWMAVDG